MWIHANHDPESCSCLNKCDLPPDDLSMLQVGLHFTGDLALAARGRDEELHQLQQSAISVHLLKASTNHIEDSTEDHGF
jgi:hypothetical protein